MNGFQPSSIEVGDQILAVNDQKGCAEDLMVAWRRIRHNGTAWPGGSPLAPLRLTTLRPLLLLPLTVRVEPEKDIGLQVASTGVIEEINAGGLVAELNSACPGTV